MRGKAKRRIAKTVFLIIISIALFSVIIFSLYKIDFIGIFDALPSLFGGKEEKPLQNYSDKINGILDLLGEEGDDYEIYSTDAATLISMLSSAERDESYYHAYNVKYTDGDNVKIKNVRVQKRGEIWSVHVLENDVVVNTVSYEDGEYLVRDDLTGEMQTFSKNASISFEEQTYLTPISEIVALLSEYESASDSGASRISDCELSLARSQNSNLISLKFKYDSTGQVEEYVVDLDHLVVLIASSSINDDLYYEVTTTTFDPDVQ